MQMDPAYSALDARLKVNVDQRLTFTRFESNKPDFTSVVTEKTVPFGLFTTFKVQTGASQPSKAKPVLSITSMPYNNTAIPPPEEITGSASLPRMDS